MEVQTARGLAADHHGESIVEAQRVHDFQAEARGVLSFDLVVDICRVAFHRLLQNGGECRAGILHVGVDAPRQQRLMSDVSAGEIKPPLHVQSRLRFQVLREHFAQDDLFGEVLGPDHQRLLPPGPQAGKNMAPGRRAKIVVRRSHAARLRRRIRIS